MKNTFSSDLDELQNDLNISKKRGNPRKSGIPVNRVERTRKKRDMTYYIYTNNNSLTENRTPRFCVRAPLSLKPH